MLNEAKMMYSNLSRALSVRREELIAGWYMGEWVQGGHHPIQINNIELDFLQNDPLQ